MQLLGPIVIFNTETYKPDLKTVIITGSIGIHTHTTDIDHHRLFAAISGQPLVAVADFQGAKFDYHRQLAVAGQAEKVNLQLQGIYKNQLFGNLSDIVTVAYAG